MYTLDKGIPVRSVPLNFVAGTTPSFDLSFVHGYAGRMRAPVVREVVFEFVGSITGDNGGGTAMAAEDACMIFNRVLMSDMGGEYVNWPGKVIRAAMIKEYGEIGSRDADQGGAIADGATNAAYRFQLRIPFDLPMARRGSDTSLPANHLAAGTGRVQIGLADPLNGQVNAGSTITMYVILHDEGTKELKARLVRRTLPVTRREEDYRFQGSTRRATLLSNPETTGLAAWAIATFPNITVTELEYALLSVNLLRSEYARCRPDRSAADPIIAGNGIPLIWPSTGQRIDKMPDLTSLRVTLPADPPAAAELVVEYIEDRYPPLAAEWLGYRDQTAYVRAVNSPESRVNLGSGVMVHPSALGAIANRMAMRVPLAGRD